METDTEAPRATPPEPARERQTPQSPPDPAQQRLKEDEKSGLGGAKN